MIVYHLNSSFQVSKSRIQIENITSLFFQNRLSERNLYQYTKLELITTRSSIKTFRLLGLNFRPNVSCNFSSFRFCLRLILNTHGSHILSHFKIARFVVSSDSNSVYCWARYFDIQSILA